MYDIKIKVILYIDDNFTVHIHKYLERNFTGNFLHKNTYQKTQSARGGNE